MDSNVGMAMQKACNEEHIENERELHLQQLAASSSRHRGCSPPETIDGQELPARWVRHRGCVPPESSPTPPTIATHDMPIPSDDDGSRIQWLRKKASLVPAAPVLTAPVAPALALPVLSAEGKAYLSPYQCEEGPYYTMSGCGRIYMHHRGIAVEVDVEDVPQRPYTAAEREAQAKHQRKLQIVRNIYEFKRKVLAAWCDQIKDRLSIEKPIEHLPDSNWTHKPEHKAEDLEHKSEKKDDLESKEEDSAALIDV